MRIVVDLDGVVCGLKAPQESYSDVKPNLDMIKNLYRWREEGHTIILHTARHMRTCNGNVDEVIRKVGDITTEWLSKWKVPYDELYFGKPYGDIYIDDLALTFTDAKSIDRSLGDLKPILVITMAGKGRRFVEAGFIKPKYMINVNGKSLLEWSLESLPLDIIKKIIFVCLREHENHNVSNFIHQIMGKQFPRPNYQIIFIEHPTRGQAETALACKSEIDNNDPLVIYNIDTYFSSSRLKSKILSFKMQKIDGILGAFTDSDPRWSFIDIGTDGYVRKVVEKVPISTIASTGLYIFSDSRDFINAAEYIIGKDIKVKNEYYISEVYNVLISQGKKFIIDLVDNFACYGTPDDIERYAKSGRAQ